LFSLHVFRTTWRSWFWSFSAGLSSKVIGRNLHSQGSQYSHTATLRWYKILQFSCYDNPLSFCNQCLIYTAAQSVWSILIQKHRAKIWSTKFDRC
jgi:hypothetical protein